MLLDIFLSFSCKVQMQVGDSLPLLGSGTFRYLNLPTSSLHIPLLHLDPATNIAAPLTCRLSVVSIDSVPAFRALSYTWGPDARTHDPLIAVGHTTEQHCCLHITASLDDILRHLRHVINTLILWIDQICINQANTVEKALQVRKMVRAPDFPISSLNPILCPPDEVDVQPPSNNFPRLADVDPRTA